MSGQFCSLSRTLQLSVEINEHHIKDNLLINFYFSFLFAIPAAGVVPFGVPKNLPLHHP